MKFLYSLCKCVIVFLFCINICAGCNSNKTEIIQSKPQETDVPGKRIKFNADGISIINKSNSLDDTDVEKFSREIRGLFYKNWGEANKYSSFYMVKDEYNKDLEIHFNTNNFGDDYEILCYKDGNENELFPFDKYKESDKEMIEKGRKVFRQYLQDELQYKE